MTPPQGAKAAWEQRVAQQAAVAALGQAALAETSVGNLMTQVVQCIQNTLGTEFVKVLELAPGGGELLLRAGVGWTPGLVGRATVGAGRDSQAGFTLLEDRPVVVRDLRTESRFTGPPLLIDHGVVSGMSCAIRSLDGTPYGVLGTHTRSRREFSDGDVDFLRSVANVLAAALARLRTEAALREAESHLAAEVGALGRLNELSSRLWQMPGLHAGLEEMLHATVALLGADKGNIQLLEGEVLRIVAQRGFDRPFLEHFREVTIKGDSACARALRSGGVVVIDDVDADEAYAPLRPVARKAGYRAVLSTPLIARDGGTLGMISVHFQSPHRPNAQDLQRLTLYVRQAADFIERCRGEQALRESEERNRRVGEQLRLVTDTMAASVTLCSRDLRYVWVSRAYAEWLGRSSDELVGRPIIEILGSDAFGKLLPRFETVLSGQQVRYEEEAEFLGVGRRWISAVYTPTFDAAGEPDGWVAVVSDIDQRRRMEQALRESEAQQAFLVRLDNALRPLADAAAIQNAAARVLGDELLATRVMYADAEGEPGAEEGAIGFGERVMALRRRGETMVVADVTTDPAFSASERAAWIANGVRAAITVSLAKEGRVVAELGVHSAAPREWTAHEVARVEATAERTWAAVERARVEEALRRERNRIQQYLDVTGSLMVALDGDGRVVLANRKTCDTLGYSESQIIGTDWFERCLPEQERGRVREVFHRVVRGEGSFEHFENRVLTANGDERLIQWHNGAIRDPDGQLLSVLGSGVDVTERHRAEEALRKSEAMLASVFDALPVAAGIVDADGTVVLANQEVERYLPTRLIPSRDKARAHRWRATHPNGRPVEPDDYPGARALRGERVVPGVEFRYTQDDGTEVWTQVAAVPLRGTGDSITGQVFVINDIDAVKRAEEALRENRAREEAHRLKDEFLANMSHELRTPLNAIIGFADLMYRGKAGPLAPDHHEYLGDILTSSRHLLQLVNDVLDLAKIEAGKMDVRPEPVNLEQLTAEVRDVLRGLAARKQLHVAVQVEEEVRRVSVDPARMKQILYNLLSNALKFTPEGGRIAIRIAPEGQSEFRIDVEDTGIGVHPQHMGQLFVPFQQIDASSAKRHQGTGLGLALTKRIAEAHGGRVAVRSVPDAGSTFSVILPRGMAPDVSPS